MKPWTQKVLMENYPIICLLIWLLAPIPERLSDTEKEKINQNALGYLKNSCDVLVFGHTHNPFINNEKNVVNLGSWLKSPKIHNTYLEIKGKDMHLYHMKNGNRKEITDG